VPKRGINPDLFGPDYFLITFARRQVVNAARRRRDHGEEANTYEDRTGRGWSAQGPRSGSRGSRFGIGMGVRRG
jgi:hypothetical protein